MAMTFEYLPREDIYVIFADLPDGVEGFCKEVGAYRYAYINRKLDDDQKREALIHEILHLARNDLYKDFEELEVI